MKFNVLGMKYPRKDGVLKVTGQAVFPSDVRLPGMLHGRVLTSIYPHALVKNIDTSKAEKAGAVCLTYEDVPKKKYNERMFRSEITYQDRTVLSEKARQVGDPIAAVAAETEEKAEEALQLIKVEYEPLPAYFDPYEAQADEAVNIHDSAIWGAEEIKIKNNLSCTREFVNGNVEEGFYESDVIIENEFKTGRAYHATLEPRGCVCKPEVDGNITVWCTTQTIHHTRQLLGYIFDIPLSKINVKRIASGGSFGCGIQTNTVIPICVALALKSRQSVKLIATREEDMYDHCRYPMIIKLKLGAKNDGTLVAGEMEVVTDIGSHYVQAHALLEMPVDAAGILYRIPNLKYIGKAIYTNKAPACAMQGYGLPQATFALESSMDILAEELDIDPVALRLKNYVGLGESFWVGGFSVKLLMKSSGVSEMLKRGAELIEWNQRKTAGDQQGPTVRGLGMARAYNVSGTGSPPPRKTVEYSSAMVRINEDGSVDILTALMDLGGGSLDAAAKIVSEELGVPLEKINVVASDTSNTGYDVCTHASRGVYVGGGAVLKAAQEAKRKLLEIAATLLNSPPEVLRTHYEPDIEDIVIFLEGNPERKMTASQVVRKAQLYNLGSVMASEGLRPVHCAPNFSTLFIEVDVNLETGEIKPVKAVMGVDGGTVINPELATGQIHGGLCRGLGFALLEDTQYNPETGKLNNQGSFTDYKMIGSADMLRIDQVETFFVPTWEPTGPFGAKGLGEGLISPVAPAIINAIYNATGIRFFEIPLTPEKVLAAIKRRRQPLRGGSQ